MEKPERKFRIRYLQEEQNNIPEQIIERIYNFNELLKYGKPHKIENIISIDDWTGLKDNEGTEIFESDICTLYMPDDYDKKVPNRTIVFEWKGNGWFLKGFNRLCGTYYFGAIKGDMLKIIGNIYENPELLENQ